MSENDKILQARKDFAVTLKGFLDRGERFVLSGHIRPDGDSVGVCAAMAFALRDMGKEAYITFDGDVTRYLPLIPEELPVIEAEQLEMLRGFSFIMLDCGEPERCGKAESLLLRAKGSLCIDHHITSGEGADFNYVEGESTSTCEVLYRLFELIGCPLTPSIASALFMGCAFDTGGFRHSSVTPATYEMLAELVKAGANPNRILNGLFHTRRFSEARGLSLAINKAKLYDGCILVCPLTLGDVFRINTKMAELDGVVGQLIEIEEAEVAVLLRENDDGSIRVNMRSKEKVDVARIAACYGGGGHVRAAGCTVQEPMLLVKEGIVEAIRRQLAEYDAQNK